MSVLVVGTTPTVQRTLFFDRLALGAVNRARAVHITASGKAVNVARVVKRLDGESRLEQFLGGEPGRFLARALDTEGVAHETVWTADDAPTRTCTTLLSRDEPATELVEEAPPVTPDDVNALEESIRRRLPDSRWLCLSGSLAPGVPDDFYARLVAAAHEYSIPAFVDTQRAPLRAALAAPLFLVKPNREEAAATLDLPLTDDPDADAAAAVTALTEAGAQWALVSLGATGSLLGDASGNRWRIAAPRVEAVNPIGSGDSLLAGTLVALQRGASVPDAVVYGTACAGANCLTPTSGVVHAGDVASLLDGVQISPL